MAQTKNNQAEEKKKIYIYIYKYGKKNPERSVNETTNLLLLLFFNALKTKALLKARFKFGLQLTYKYLPNAFGYSKMVLNTHHHDDKPCCTYIYV